MWLGVLASIHWWLLSAFRTNATPLTGDLLAESISTTLAEAWLKSIKLYNTGILVRDLAPGDVNPRRASAKSISQQ